MMAPGSAGQRRAQPRVKSDHRPQIGARPRQFERERTTEAVTNRSHLRGVNLLLRQKHIQSGSSQPTSEVGVRPEHVEAGHCLLSRQRPTLSVVVDRERHVPEAGQTDGAALHMLIEPWTFVTHQHRRSRSDSILVQGKLADHLLPVDFVRDVLDPHDAQDICDVRVNRCHRSTAER